MPPRRRDPKKRGWPDNLYERDGYYSWRNPLTHRELGIGRVERGEAFAQAVEANLKIAGLTMKPRLIDRLTGESDRSIEAWDAKYQRFLGKQKLAANTLRSYKSLGRRMVAGLGARTPIAHVTALEASALLESIETEGHERLAQALRSFMRDSFRQARVEGWTRENPILDTRTAVRVPVKRARLTFEQFEVIYAASAAPQWPAWLRNTIALGIVSAQAREEISAARVADVRDDGWYIERKKTGARTIVPLELRLERFGMSLGEVVKQCRATGVLSRHLIHQTATRGNSPAGAPIWIDTISRRFTELVESLELDWQGKEPATFHEIRSLSARLYRAQGINTQELLGHKDPGTTEIYQDVRGAEWVRVKLTV